MSFNSDINEDKSAAAVLTGDIGELPDVANADGAAGTKQDEAQTASQMFSLHIFSSKK